MGDLEPGAEVVLDKRGADEYRGEILEVTQGDGDVRDVLVAWETGDESWYHGYELDVQD